MKAPKKFQDFILQCDQNGIEPLEVLKQQAHERIDKTFSNIESKYRTGRDGQTWADVADQVYNDVKDGIDEVTQVIADAVYGND